jgi:hypothetical protein
MDFLSLVPAAFTFLSANWDSIVLVAIAAKTGLDMVKKSQFSLLWPLALEVVKAVAHKQIDGVQKRKQAVDLLMSMAPPLVKKVISREEMELLIEEAYLFLRGEIKKESLKVE